MTSASRLKRPADLKKGPTKDEIIAEVSYAREEDVNAAVAAAEQAQPAWAALPAKSRARIMRRFADLMEENSLKIAEVLPPSSHQCCDTRS